MIFAAILDNHDVHNRTDTELMDEEVYIDSPYLDVTCLLMACVLLSPFIVFILHTVVIKMYGCFITRKEALVKAWERRRSGSNQHRESGATLTTLCDFEKESPQTDGRLINFRILL